MLVRDLSPALHTVARSRDVVKALGPRFRLRSLTMDLAVPLYEAAQLVVLEHSPAGSGRELVLHDRLRTALARVARLTVAAGERRLDDHGRGWTRAPGGIDILAEAPSQYGSLACGAEVKIRKLDELLWDAIKLGQRRSDEPWPRALAAAAIVVELQPVDLEYAPAPRWFDAAVTEFEVYDAIRAWPKAWYGLMCGGRGIRPTSLPKFVRLGAGGVHRYADGTLLCWRVIEADHVDSTNRIAVDAHGIPDGIDIPEKWRRQIHLAAQRKHSRRQEPLRRRETLRLPPSKTTVALADDGSGRLWADVWDVGFTVPTSFRLVGGGSLDYDLRIASNEAQHHPSTPKPLPEWCRAAVKHALERRR